MDTRTKRFVAAIAYTEWLVAERVTPEVAGWRFRCREHPIAGYPMASARGPVAYPAYYDPASRLSPIGLEC